MELLFQNPSILAAIIGGIVGAASKEVFARLRRPILKVLFDEKDPGCAIPDIPGWRCDEKGKKISGRTSYLRIRVENVGGTTAHGVNVCVTKIAFFPNHCLDTESHENIFEEEVLEITLALSNRTEFDLPEGGHRYVNLFCVEDSVSGPQARFTPSAQPNRLSARSYRIGKYQAQVFVSSNNSSSEIAKIVWRWDGSLEGLKINGCL